MQDRIILKGLSKAPKEERRCVQISGEANSVLIELCRATGRSVGYIVSQMIIQGARLVDVIEEEGGE